MDKATISPRDAAVRLCCTMKHIYELLYAARLPGAKKLGARWRIPLEAVEQRRKAREARNG